MDSILTSVKKGIGGLIEENESFDQELVMFINGVLNFLTQIGVGPEQGFVISGKTETWSDFIDDKRLEMVKTYVVLKTKLVFDPPSNGTILQSLNACISELESRINISVDP